VRDFKLLQPASAREASRMLADHGEDARLMAGGTALTLALRQRLVTPSHLVHLGKVSALAGIAFDEKAGLRIGALARHADLAAHPAVNARYPMLAHMAGQVANPQVRNQGTVAGNLCYADPASDPPTCLMALGARVVATSAQGEREIALDEFFSDYYQTALGPAEVITEIRVPPLGEAAGAYARFRRSEAEHRPTLTLGIVARREAKVCRSARIVIGASTAVPFRAKGVERLLEGKAVTPELLEQAAESARAETPVISDFRGSAEYRREIVGVLLRRTAASLFGVEAN
jgi:carbon-monoxide dehydrogenase medium subunit